MSIKKRIILIVLAVLLAAGGVTTAVLLRGRGDTIDVTSVSMVSSSYWGDSLNFDGNVTTGKVQDVALRNALVSSIDVSVGDHVSVGDVLMTYDTTQFQLTLQSDEAKIAVLKSQITLTQNDIAKYRGLRPSEDAPQPTEEVIDHGELVIRTRIDASDFTGDGQVFCCDANTVISAAFLQQLRASGASVELRMYDGITLFGSWTLEGGTLPATRTEYVADEASDPADPRYVAKAVEAIDRDWTPGNCLSFNGDGVDVDLTGSEPVYGQFTSCTPQDYERYETIYHDNYTPDGSENYQYSKAELADMIAQAEQQLASTQIDLKAAQLTYEQDQLVSETGQVLASIDGEVTEVKDVAELAEGDTIISVKGESNFTVTCYVGELNLEKVTPGTTLTVYAYESGVNTTVTVTEIGTTPASGSYGWGNENPNNSYYPVTAIVDDPSVQLRIGEWCQLTLDSTDEEGGTYLPLYYVRSDDAGSYVMVANENGRLEKRYIKTGKTVWGSMIEIKGGLSQDDLIAFPYGKTAREGVKVQETEDVTYY